MDTYVYIAIPYKG